jgi:hypothetical protein
MTIWILVVIVLASLAGLGFRQGAIKVAFSFVGILVGALLAVPLGHLVGRLLGVLGVKDPLLIWALGPLIVFILVSAAFKVAAAAVHQKVDVYYKYHAGDLRLALWERLNHRLGLCLGVLNGAAYLVLLSFLIYVPSYLTTQLATSEQDPKWMRVLNTLGRDLHRTGFAKVARSLDSIPRRDYEMADLGALIYHNPLLEARLNYYPAFLGLSEMPEFQALANDAGFTKSWQNMDPIMTLLENPNLQAIRGNTETLKLVWNTVEINLPDLRKYLHEGVSERYDPVTILGRWDFDVSGAVSAARRAKPNMSAKEMQALRAFMEAAFKNTGLVAKPDKTLTVRSMPQLKMSPAGGAPGQQQNLQGQWKDLDSTKYRLSFSGTDLNATVEGDRMMVKNEGGIDLVFNREF